MQSKLPVNRALPIIRVFVSSTFSDLKRERNALHAKVWPELERYCQKRGFTFLAIDLRWGVHTEAELLIRRAMAIDEQSYGAEHPDVACDPNNLAQLLKATNRLTEAEPLLRRMVTIVLKFTQTTRHQRPHLKGCL